MDTQANSETFLNLLSVVRENRAEREKMLSILALEATRRKMAINILVTEMRRKNAPQDFVEAWDALQDDGLAEEARRIIEDQAYDTTVDRKTSAFILAILVLVIAIVVAVALNLKR